METGWRVSGFNPARAHFIYEDGEYLQAACGVMWWMSDGVTSMPWEQVPQTRKCGRCVRTRKVRRE